MAIKFQLSLDITFMASYDCVRTVTSISINSMSRHGVFIISHKCSIGERSGKYAGQGITSHHIKYYDDTCLKESII